MNHFLTVYLQILHIKNILPILFKNKKYIAQKKIYRKKGMFSLCISSAFAQTANNILDSSL